EEESDNKIVRFLGIWLNCKLNESLVKARAIEIVRSIAQQLSKKRITLSKIAYVNNMCILSKLCYLLQTVKISTKAIEQIHIPLLRIAKNKAELQVTESRAVISHKDIENCKQLKNELLNKQAISLYHRINEKGAAEVVTDIHINQGFLLAVYQKEATLMNARTLRQRSGNITWHI
ncbi:17754_t:CDS:1, partial [Gigaspora rosea]